jgi:hypothetical protein
VCEQNSFQGIITGDELWFLYAHRYNHTYEASRPEVIPREGHTIGAKKIIIIVFFSGERLLVLEVLPQRKKFNQDCFL